MKSYSKVYMEVNGKETATLDIYKKSNTFHIFEHDINIFSGGYLNTISFINEWIDKKQDLISFMKNNKMKVEIKRKGI